MQREIKNISNPLGIRPCTSCQMCYAVCNVHAMNIVLTKEGFYRPYVDENLCVGCGRCVDVCAKFENDILVAANITEEETPLYSASVKDEEIVRKTTSGGIADTLAKALINEGYKIIGVAYNNKENRAEHVVAETVKESDVFRGSKYIQSYSADAFRQLVKSGQDEIYAIFGLPCQIYAINKYLKSKKQESKWLLIDLYCHGCPSMLVWNKVSDDLKKRLKTKQFESVKWRSKYRGWGRFYLEVKSHEGRIYRSRPNDNSFFDFFFSNQLLKESCSDCKFRSTLAYTDIRLGDFWGPDYKSDTRGVSAISVATDKGAAVIDSIRGQINITKKSYDNFLPYQSWGCVYHIDNILRHKLLTLLADKNASIEECLRPLKERYSFSKKAKIFFKQILSYLPLSLERKFI